MFYSYRLNEWQQNRINTRKLILKCVEMNCVDKPMARFTPVFEYFVIFSRFWFSFPPRRNCSIITGRNVGQVMFLHLSLSHYVHRVGEGVSTRHPPLGRHPLGRHLQADTPWADIPEADTSPGQTPPRQTPPQQTLTRADTPPPGGHYS